MTVSYRGFSEGMHTKEQRAYLLGDIAMDETLSVEKRQELGNEGLQFLHRHV